MGFLTTITLRNDHKHDHEHNLGRFAQELFEAIDHANEHHTAWNRGGIIAQPSCHADDHQVYVHYGNTVLCLNPYGGQFKELLSRDNLEVAEDYVKTAEALVKHARAKLNEAKKTAKSKGKSP